MMADNYFLKLAKSRKTTYEFSDKQVSDKDIKSILEAGSWAPSCENSQPWHFIVVRNKDSIKRLMMTANYGDFHNDPDVIVSLVLLSSKCAGKGYTCFRGKDSGVHDTFMCMGMAGLNMALQARDLDIDSCIITPEQESVKKILKVNKLDSVPLLLGLGYQDKKSFQKKRERLKLSEITSKEFFGRKLNE